MTTAAHVFATAYVGAFVAVLAFVVRTAFRLARLDASLPELEPAPARVRREDPEPAPPAPGATTRSAAPTHTGSGRSN